MLKQTLKLIAHSINSHMYVKFCLYYASLPVPWVPDTLLAQLFSPVPEVHLKKSFILPLPHSLHLLSPPLPPPVALGRSTHARVLPAST